MRVTFRARRWALVTLVFAAGAAFAPSAARADEARGIAYDLPMDLGVTVVAAALLGGSEIVVKDQFALSPNWTSVNGADASVRDSLRWSNHGTANVISYVTAGAAGLTGWGLTALATARDGRPAADFWIDTLLIAEATALDGAFNQLVKFTVRRARPCAAGYTCPRDTLGDATHAPIHDKDSNVSFYSEHTSLIFAVAGSAGMIAKLRGHRLAPVIWLSTAVLGATTAYLRIAANEHYLTDVLTGAAMGTLFGVAVPYLFHRARSETGGRATVMVLPQPRGATLAYALRW